MSDRVGQGKALVFFLCDAEYAIVSIKNLLVESDFHFFWLILTTHDYLLCCFPFYLLLPNLDFMTKLECAKEEKGDDNTKLPILFNPLIFLVWL